MRRWIYWTCLSLAVGMLAFGTGYTIAQVRGPARGATQKVRARIPKFHKSFVEKFSGDAREQLVGDPVYGGSPGQPANGGGDDPGGTVAGKTYPWSEMISSETIEDEIKVRLAVPLRSVVKVPGPFKSSGFKDARRQLSTLAMLFGVIAEYDGDVRWKKAAAKMRDAMARAGKNCKVGSTNSHKEAKARSQDLDELIGGGKADHLPDPDPDHNWSTVLDFSPAMQRMQLAGEIQLKQWTASEAEFKANLDRVSQEAQILAVLATVIKDEEYGFAPDELYEGYANTVQQESLKIVDAVKNNDYDAAASAVGAINKSCSACHGDFR